MNRITEAHIFVWRATPAIQCALRLFDSFNSETTKINYQFLNELKYGYYTVYILNRGTKLSSLNVNSNDLFNKNGRAKLYHEFITIPTQNV